MKTLSIFALLFVSSAFAEDRSTVPAEALGKAPARTAAPRARVNAAAVPNAAQGITDFGMLYEPLTTEADQLIVPANGYRILESHLDFTGADHVSVAIFSANIDVTSIKMVTAWAAPGLWYNSTDAAVSSRYPFLDHGGMTTPVFGPFLKVLLFNNSNVAVPVKQVTVYAVPAKQ